MFQDNKFRALYYPHSRCYHETDLKRALLIFDEILFVDPIPDDIINLPSQGISSLSVPLGKRHMKEVWSDSYYESFDPTNWYDISHIYQDLKQYEILKLVSPSEHLKAESEILSYSVFNDLLCFDLQRDELPRKPLSFLYRKDPIKYGWILHKSRVPKKLIELLTDKKQILNFIENLSIGSFIKQKIKDDFESPFKDTTYMLFHYPSVIEHINTHDVFYVEHKIALSLIINQALLLCDKFHAFPFTDDPLAHGKIIQMLHYLYDTSPTMIRDITPKANLSKSYLIQYFTASVVSRLIPDEIFERLSIEDVVKLRHKNSYLLDSFKDKMLALSYRITKKPWDDDFTEEILKIIEGEIVPEVNRIDIEMKQSLRNLFGKSILEIGSTAFKTISPMIPTMTIATFMGLSLSQIVLLGAAAAASTMSIVLHEFANYLKERRSLTNNGLTFLLNLGQSFDYKKGEEV